LPLIGNAVFEGAFGFLLALDKIGNPPFVFATGIFRLPSQVFLSIRLCLQKGNHIIGLCRAFETGGNIFNQAQTRFFVIFL
jgi:hypothetical protein